MAEQPTTRPVPEDPKVPESAEKPAEDRKVPARAEKPAEDPKVPEPPERPPEDVKVPRAPEPPVDPIEHDRRVRRFLLRLSLANWGVAIVAWTISAFLGITSPASIFVYSVLFVIGLFAVIVALLTYLLEKFGHEPPVVAPGAPSDDEDDAGDTPEGAAPAAAAS